VQTCMWHHSKVKTHDMLLLYLGILVENKRETYPLQKHAAPAPM